MAETSEGISDYRTEIDRVGIHADYTRSYEDLATEDLDGSLIDPRYLVNQSKNMARFMGDVRGKNVCDLGVGQGFLCDELVKKGAATVTAVDIAAPYLQRFRDHPIVAPVLANAERLPFDSHFDVVSSTDVMEHVLNVGSYMFCLNRALVAGGTAAVRVPYRKGLLGYSPHRGCAYDFVHLRSFDRKLLRLYFEEAGFTIESMKLDGFSPGTPHPRLYDSTRKRVWYGKFAEWLNGHLEHPADATFIDRRLAGLVMRPTTVVVIATKTSSL